MTAVPRYHTPQTAPKLPRAREVVFRVKVDPQKGALWCLHHLEQLIEKFRIAIRKLSDSSIPDF
jgi:hypothetical protein